MRPLRRLFRQFVKALRGTPEARVEFLPQWTILIIALSIIGVGILAFSVWQRGVIERQEQERLKALVHILDANIAQNLEASSQTLDNLRADFSTVAHGRGSISSTKAHGGSCSGDSRHSNDLCSR